MKNATSAQRRRRTTNAASARGTRIFSRSSTKGWSAKERKSAKKSVTKRTLPAQRSPTTAAVARTASARERKAPPSAGLVPVVKAPLLSKRGQFSAPGEDASGRREAGRSGERVGRERYGKVTVTTARRFRVASSPASASPLASTWIRAASMPCLLTR